MDGRLLLLKHFQERKNRNTSYSLRAFARDMQVSVSALSQYLSRKRDLSKSNKMNILNRLQFSPLERQIFLERKPGSKSDQAKALLSEDLFNAIGDWISFALLSLAKINYDADPQGLSKRLAVDTTTVQRALERLIRLKLIQIKNHKLKRTENSFSTTDDIPSQAIRKFHLSALQKAQEALADEPIERRDYTAMVFPASTKNMNEIKKILRSAQNRIAKLAHTNDADDVFVMAMQYFPLTAKGASR